MLEVKEGVMKKKSASGCLVIKTKVGNGDSSCERSEKKSSRMIESGNSGSSDEDKQLAIIKKKVNEKKIRKGSLEIKKNDKDMGVVNSSSKKRSGFDLFEFDEYDEFDTKKMKCGPLLLGQNGNGKTKKLEVSSRKKSVVDKRKKSVDFDGCRSSKSRGKDFDDMRNEGLDLEEDEEDMPCSLSRLKNQSPGDELIRLQGKNGLLKVMVNQKKKKGLSSACKNGNPEDVKQSKDSESGDFVKDSYQSPKSLKNKVVVDKVKSSEKLKKGKEEGKYKHVASTEKQLLREKIKEMLVEAGWTIDYRPRRNRDYLDAVYMNPRGTGYWSITKAYDAFKKQLEEDNDESKSNAGSISSAPLAEDLVNKLTRRTKKKIQAEMRTKNRHDIMAMNTDKSPITESSESSDNDEEDETLSFFLKQKNKSQRDRSCEVDLETDEKANKTAKPNTTQGGTNALTTSRCTLMVRDSTKGEDTESDGFIPYNGKRMILAWVIDSGTAKPSERVKYMNKKRSRVMQEGWITREGIHCGCCSKILTVSKFEMHAGSKSRQPFENIFLESGSSLLQCQLDAWNKQDESIVRGFHNIGADGDDPDDDTCGICGDGGDLLCCDSCTSTFHLICLGMKIHPSDDWHCPNCTCKFCGMFNGKNDVNELELSHCSFCGKNYHRSCGKKVCEIPLSSHDAATFCELTCQKLYDHFQKIVGVRHELEAGYSWCLLQRTDVSDTSHQEFTNRVECNSKLAVALSVMNECFLPIIDRRSGTNIIPSVVYNCGSNFNRLDYRRFYTAILERGDEIVCAASIRIHGTRLAEIPFIGTREKYRRQGLCSRFLSAIENELRSAKVARLIIPAIAEHTSTWTNGFGFHELDDAHRKELKSINMLVFPGTDMLQKQLVEQETPDEVKEASEATKNQSQSPLSVEEPGNETGRDSEAFHESKTNDEALKSNNLSDEKDGALRLEMENEQKEPPPSSLIRSCYAHGSASSDKTNGLAEEADKDNVTQDNQ